MPRTPERTRLSGEQVCTLFTPVHPFRLESGRTLAPVEVAYETWGTLSADGSNAILICHALTANANAGGPDGWWSPLIGPGRTFDTDRYFVVCANILGSCYGTTGPTSVNPRTSEPWAARFPEISVRDIVRVQRALVDRLGVRRLAAVVGSSLGGMQVLEWGAMYPELCGALIPISVGARQSAWCLALNAIARGAIIGDPAWEGGDYRRQPEHGLTVARMVGMTSYRSPEEFEERFGRTTGESDLFDPDVQFEVERYLRYQGRKLADRFDANAYLTLSRAMDRHDVGRGRGGVERALSSISAPTLCIGVSSDLRYPVFEQEALAHAIPRAKLSVIQSVHGHDAFLIEFEALGDLIREFLQSVQIAKGAAA